MRKSNVEGKALGLNHEHFTSTQYDLLSFANNFLKSTLGLTEQGAPSSSKMLTSVLSYSNGVLSWTAGWCVIAGVIRRVDAGSINIDQVEPEVTYYFIPSTNVLSEYDYSVEGEAGIKTGCTDYTVSIASDTTGWRGFDVADKITICGRSIDFIEDSIVGFANRYYNPSRVAFANGLNNMQTIDGVSTHKANAKSFNTFFIEIGNWNMATTLEKTVFLPSHITLTESNKSLLSFSFFYVSDNNDEAKNDGYRCFFGVDRVRIVLSQLETSYYSGLGFRGILKIDTYSYAHIPA